MKKHLLVLVLSVLASCGGEKAAPERAADPFAGLTPGWNHIVAGGETLCSNGGAYSFWFRPGDATRLAIYFQGGGACWRPRTCALDRNPTYDPAVDSTDDPSTRHGIFDFANQENPLAEYSILYIPYCTADAHMGDTVQVYDVPATAGQPAESVTIHHVGAVNAGAALAWVYGRITDPTTVFVSGGSAGAIGSAFHAYDIAAHYPRARVAQLGDAAGSYRSPIIPEIFATWNAPSQLPAFPEYREPSKLTFETLYEASHGHADNLRMAQFNTVEDTEQLRFLRLAGIQDVPLRTLLDQNLAEIHAADPTFRSYLGPGGVHEILIRSSLYTTEVDGVRLVDWIRGLATGNDVADVNCEKSCR